MTNLFARLQPHASGSQLLRSAAISAALLTGCAGLLVGGSAKAAAVATVDTCTFGVAGATCPTYTTAPGRLADKIFSVVKAPNQGSGEVKFTWVDYTGDGLSLDDDWSSVIDWGTPGLIGPLAVGEFDYTLSIDPASGYSFGVVSLDSLEGGSAVNPTTVTKELFEGLTATNSLGVLTSVDGGHDELDLAGTGIQQLYVKDRWSVPEQHTLETLSNGFTQTVPGPLPLLGAAAAFGWSRKLRRRVGTASLG